MGGSNASADGEGSVATPTTVTLRRRILDLNQSSSDEWMSDDDDVQLNVNTPPPSPPATPEREAWLPSAATGAIAQLGLLVARVSEDLASTFLSMGQVSQPQAGETVHLTFP